MMRCSDGCGPALRAMWVAVGKLFYSGCELLAIGLLSLIFGPVVVAVALFAVVVAAALSLAAVAEEVGLRLARLILRLLPGGRR